jgi:hypothetical protein
MSVLLEWSAVSTADKVLCHGSTFSIVVRLHNRTCEPLQLTLQQRLGTQLKLWQAPRGVCLESHPSECEPKPCVCKPKKKDCCSCSARACQRCDSDSESSEECAEEKPICAPKPVECQTLEAELILEPWQHKRLEWTLYVTQCFPLPCSTTTVKIVELDNRPSGLAQRLFLGATPLTPKPFYVAPPSK